MMNPTIRQGTIDDLRELLQAVDRRLPRLAHADEPAIAKAAAALREQAVALLARLEALESQPDADGAADRAKRLQSVGQRAPKVPPAPGGGKGDRLTKSGRHKRSE